MINVFVPVDDSYSYYMEVMVHNLNPMASFRTYGVFRDEWLFAYGFKTHAGEIEIPFFDAYSILNLPRNYYLVFAEEET